MQERQTPEWFKQLLEEAQAPCVSIYMPVNRGYRPAGANPTRYKSHVQQAREEMLRRYSKEQIQPVMDQLESVGPEADWWQRPGEALAVFAAPNRLEVIDLFDHVDDFVGVADSFHVKPLIRILQNTDRFQVLGFTQNSVRLYQATRNKLEEVELNPNVPRSIFETLKGATNSTPPPDVDYGEQRMKGSGQPPTDRDLVNFEHFLRAVDESIWRYHTRVSQLPLILAADPRYHDMFHKITVNQYLLTEGIMIDPEGVEPDRLRDMAWEILQPRYAEQMHKLKDQFMAAKARRQASDALMEVAEMTAVGRVGTLLVQSDRKIPGRLLRASGQVTEAKLEDPHADDILDDLAEMVLKMDGQVFVVPPEHMPTDQGLAAIYRY